MYGLYHTEMKGGLTKSRRNEWVVNRDNELVQCHGKGIKEEKKTRCVCCTYMMANANVRVECEMMERCVVNGSQPGIERRRD